jgi:hypothetical protein
MSARDAVGYLIHITKFPHRMTVTSVKEALKILSLDKKHSLWGAWNRCDYVCRHFRYSNNTDEAKTLFMDRAKYHFSQKIEKFLLEEIGIENNPIGQIDVSQIIAGNLQKVRQSL